MWAQGGDLTVVDAGHQSVKITSLITQATETFPTSGNITAHGIYATSVVTSPGYTPAFPSNGINGGTITIYGPSRLESVIANGGNSADINDDEAASGAAGNAGNIVLVGQVFVESTVNFNEGTARANAGMGGVGGAGSPGLLTLRAGPAIPVPSPDAASVLGAVINGVFYGNSYP